MGNIYTYAKRQIAALYNIKTAMEKALREENMGFFDGLKVNKENQALYCQEFLDLHEEDFTAKQHEELSKLLDNVLALFDQLIDPRKFMN